MDEMRGAIIRPISGYLILWRFGRQSRLSATILAPQPIFLCHRYVIPSIRTGFWRRAAVFMLDCMNQERQDVIISFTWPSDVHVSASTRGEWKLWGFPSVIAAFCLSFFIYVRVGSWASKTLILCVVTVIFILNLRKWTTNYSGKCSS